MNNEEKEGFAYIERRAPFWIYNIDWDNPDQESISKLRNAVAGNEQYVSSNCDISEEELVEFSEKGIFEEGSLEQIAQGVLDTAFEEPLDIERKHVVNVVLSVGGPHCQISFTLDKEGELEGAEAQYQWGTSKVTRDLVSDEAERLWEKFSYIGEEIREEQSNRGPGY